MHVEVVLHTDPGNHKKFQEWVNSRDYGSRPFLREWRVYDCAIQEKHKSQFLSDLKWYHKDRLCGGFRTKFIKKLINFFIKRLGMKVIDMDKVEKTPKKWFTPIKWNDKERCTHAAYLEVIGGFKDSFDKHGHEEI